MTDTGASAPVEQVVEQQIAENPLKKVFQEDEVDRIRQETAKKSFQSGFEKAKAEILRQQQAQNAANASQPQANEAVQQPQVQQNAVTPEILNQMIQEQLARNAEADRNRQLEEQGRQVLNSIAQKSQLAKQDLPDFDEVTGQVDWSQFPQLIGQADTFDNGAHVLYHLAKNPGHIGNLMTLTNYSPSLALSEMKRVSDALKLNQMAPNMPQSNAPIGRLQTSNAGVGGGKPTMKDLRRQYKV